VKVDLSQKHQKSIEFFLKHGSLSSRILKALGEDPTENEILQVYRELGACLQENRFFTK
jgi:carboxylate-amine ligase